MKCPNCKKRDKIDIHLAEGFSQDTRECDYCGTVWTYIGEELIVIYPED